jgi:hypothetical protein
MISSPYKPMTGIYIPINTSPIRREPKGLDPSISKELYRKQSWRVKKEIEIPSKMSNERKDKPSHSSQFGRGKVSTTQHIKPLDLM